MTQLLFPQEVSTSRKASVRKITPPIQTVDNQPIKGFLIAVTILVLWFVSLVVLLPLNIFVHSPLVIGIALFWQSFLYTGLFITAHDAMHGAVVPGHPKINNAIGALALLCYGFSRIKSFLENTGYTTNILAQSLIPIFIVTVRPVLGLVFSIHEALLELD